MSLVLYTHRDDPRERLVKILGRYAQVYVDVVYVEGGQERVGGANLLGKLPFVQLEDGRGVSYIGAIMKLIARMSSAYPLYGKDEFEMAQVDSWVEWVRTDVELPLATLLYPVWKFIEGNDVDIENAMNDIVGFLALLDDHLTLNTFIVSNVVTIADIFVAFTFVPLYTELLDLPIRKFFFSFTRWFETIMNQPEFKEEFGLVSPLKANPPYKFDLSEVKLERAEKVKQEKEALRAEKEKEAQKAIEVQEETVPEPEATISNDVSYLGSIQSSFDLGEWKRKYANCQDVRTEVLDWLWENFENEGYSMWIAQYNFPEECTRGFYAINMLSGFLQRTDAVKAITRYAQSSMCVYENGDNFNIVGVWIFKGSVIPPEFAAHVDDTHYYTWTKIDPSNTTHKSEASDLWCWEPSTKWGNFTSGKSWG